MGGSTMELAAFNELPPAAAEHELRACCASPAWAATIAAGRPYPHLDSLLAAGDAALAALDWTEIGKALAAHPRIGDRPTGGGREARWSAGEQSGMRQADDEVRSALVEANQRYEDRFDHVFLICATGLGPAELLAAARRRLGNDPIAEQAEVRTELAKIVQLRLRKLFATPEAAPGGAAPAGSEV